MVTTKVDRTKNVSSYQPSNNISEQVYKSQLYTNLNLNANETFPIQRHVVTNKNVDINNPFMIFHQNVRGLKVKTNELMLQLLTEAPHLICLTEHHLKNYELDVTPISKYKLGANYCRKNLKNGGVCIYIQENLKYTNINLQKHCKEQDMEISAVQLKPNKKNTVMLCVYSAPSGDFDYFLNKFDNILDSLHNYKTELIICGNININYLDNNNKKKQLDYLLGTYNLIGIVYFPTRTTNNSATLIDNIFIDNMRNYSIKPCINGLYDYNAQLITLSNFSLPISISEPTYIRNINKNTIAEFQLQLSWEQWDNIFGNNNVNYMFNNFLNTFLRCYYSCFPKKEIKSNNTHN
jgi:exonuclease III